MKNQVIKKIFVVEGLVFACWIAMFLVFADFDNGGFYLWGGFGFCAFAFIVAAASLYLIDVKSNRSITEINVIPVYYTGIYLAAAVIINSIFVIMAVGEYNAILMLLNFIAFVVFIGVRMSTDSYANDVSDKIEYANEKMGKVSAISSNLGILISSTANEDIRKQLLKLKENVDYGNSLTSHFTESTEREFLAKLDEIKSMIDLNSEEESINKCIGEISLMWQKRTSLSSTIK